MKSLKNIFEGIFDKSNKDNVGKSLNVLFGNKYRIKYQAGMNRTNLKWFNGRVINKITKDMEYLNGDNYCYFNHDDQQMKVGKLCNWIEHINLTEWGFLDLSNASDFKEFTEKLKSELVKLGVFNFSSVTPDIRPDIWVGKTNRYGCELVISITKNNWNYDNSIQVYYEKID
jgi:hypothetical protein